MERKTNIQKKTLGYEAHIVMLKMISKSVLFPSWISLIDIDTAVHENMWVSTKDLIVSMTFLQEMWAG